MPGLSMGTLNDQWVHEDDARYRLLELKHLGQFSHQDHLVRYRLPYDEPTAANPHPCLVF
jgi:hypothetical protein